MSSRIRFSADPDTNYVFHMLSAAKCGYDNAYGEEYRPRYAPADLKCIKDQEIHLTVKGGEHCGDWYAPMVCAPARGGMTAKAYYEETINWLKESGDGLSGAERAAAESVCRVMIKHYDDFVLNIWPKEKDRIEKYIIPLQAIFEKDRFEEKAEKAVGVVMHPPGFTAALVSSVEGGAEAIDISDSQDVFGIGNSAEAKAQLIEHEFIIYLLKISLKGLDAFRSMDTWVLTEGLAEYYLQKIDCHAQSFRACQDQADWYRHLEKDCGTDAAKLYRTAWQLTH